MPVLFIGHGSPMNIILDNSYTRVLRRWAQASQAEGDHGRFRALAHERYPGHVHEQAKDDLRLLRVPG
jgi:hypothetical protein